MSKSKVTMSPGQITERWKQQMKGSVQKITDAINQVTESPMEKAAAQQNKMLTNLTAAINNGTWAARLRKVDVATWRTKTTQGVQTKLAAGVDNATNKRQTFDTWLVNRLNTLLPQIASMPSATIQDSVNRATAMIMGMAEQKYKST